MRLRKIGLLHSKSGNNYSDLALLGLYPQLDSALGLYCDKIKDTDLAAIRENMSSNYAISRVLPEQTFSSTDSVMTVNFYSDYSESIADATGKTAKSVPTINRNALVAFIPKGEDMECMEIYKLPLIERNIMEGPRVRGGVPPFEGGCAYIEIAPWDHRDGAAQVLQRIKEFETPQHRMVLEKILKGNLNKYDGSALYEHLSQTGQTHLWR